MIDSADAYSAVGLVAAVTVGWSDAAADAVAAELARTCADGNALVAASEHLAHTWTSRHRPPLGVFLEHYRAEMRRREADHGHREIPSGSTVSPKRGRAIAAAMVERGRQELRDEIRRNKHLSDREKAERIARLDAWQAKNPNSSAAWLNSIGADTGRPQS